MYKSENDGVDHINIYSKGRTELGRLLSNFAHTPFEIDEQIFQSVEGYWYWLLTGSSICKDLAGFEAKFFGKQLINNEKSLYYPEVFQWKINEALLEKVYSHDNIRDILINSSLPFAHYYVYGDKVINAGFDWLVKNWEEIRKILKRNKP